MARISTHVLDIARGAPAQGIAVELHLVKDAERRLIAAVTTNADGRLKLIDDPPAAGTYRITFDTGGYDPHCFFPRVVIEFIVRGSAQHYHVPLLLSPYGYSTYRGT